MKKLIAIIEEIDENKVTELYLGEMHGQPKIYGFSVKDSKLEKPDDNILEILKNFKLGPNRESKGKVIECDAILDKDTGLLHFFRNGQEDLEKLFMWNGVNAELAIIGYKPYKGKKPGARKMFIKGIGAIICMDIATFLFLISLVIATGIHLPINGEQITPRDVVSYIFTAEEENKFSHAIEAEDIKNYIFNESGIKNDKVKKFLWNPELINDVLPHYKGTPLDIISKIRHYCLNIEEDKSDEHAGIYKYGHTLYMSKFDEENFDEDSYNAKTLAHEYVHLLQASSGYVFVHEVIAELVAHEYFCNSSSSTDYYSYNVACKYTKVLMEIIGPEPVWDNAFRQYSTMLDDSVRPYLTEDEFQTFRRIFNMSPFYQRELLENGGYSELERILGILYMNKYESNMYDDPMINAILCDQEYDRVYFRTTLMESRESYAYALLEYMDFSEAMERNIIKCYIEEPITYEQFMDDNYNAPFGKETYIEKLCEYESIDAKFDGTNWVGTFVKNDVTYSIEEASKLGFIKLVYKALTREISANEYLDSPSNPNYSFQHYNLELKYRINEKSRKIFFNNPSKVYLPPITEKFKTSEVFIS